MKSNTVIGAFGAIGWLALVSEALHPGNLPHGLAAAGIEGLVCIAFILLIP